MMLIPADVFNTLLVVVLIMCVRWAVKWVVSIATGA